MSYIPHTEEDRAAMLAEIGVQSVADLFRDIPEAHKYPELNLMRPLSEMEVLRRLQALSESNVDTVHFINFLGAGAYDHFVPSVVKHVTRRSEFYTAYTPYQPEVSQGTLQSIFEYQSMICELTGMDVANASHYDGATSVAEAVMMAYYIGRQKRTKVILAPTLHPEYRATVQTYLQSLSVELVGEAAMDWQRLHLDMDALGALVDGNTACVVIQNPDFYGQLYGGLDRLAEKVHAAGALLIISADPISLGLFQSPAAYGADIVVGEGQPLGLGLQFGGPYLGYFACRKEHMHKMAGRVVGETVDRDGKRSFVLTLTAREQHIRRERATSNICTNQALCALAASVYLAALGPSGLRHIAALCYHKAHYAAKKLAELPGFSLVGDRPFFKEFVLRCPQSPQWLNDKLLEQNIIGGYDLGRSLPRLAEHMLLCVTETVTKEEIDLLVKALAEATR